MNLPSRRPRSAAAPLSALVPSAALALAMALGLGVPRAQAQTRDGGAPPRPIATAAVTDASTDVGPRIFADVDAGLRADAGPAEAVVASSEEVPGLSVRRGRSETIIDAPIEVVARAVTDFAHYDTFMPHVRDVRVVHRDHAETDVYLQVPLRGSLGVVWALVRVTVRRTPGRVELVGHAIDGNMERFESTTILERLPGPTPRTRMQFTLLALPRLPFPSSVFTREMVDAARTVANNLRARIARTLADAG